MKKLLEILIYIVLMIVIGLAINRFVYPPETIKPSAPAAQAKQDVTLDTTDFYQAELTALSGETVALRDYAGQTLIVNFWATWCAPCREEMPDLSTVYQQRKNDNVMVLGIAIDEVEAVKDFQIETPVTYPLLISESLGMRLSAILGNNKGVLPYTAIISPAGEVTKVFYGKVNQAMLYEALDQ